MSLSHRQSVGVLILAAAFFAGAAQAAPNLELQLWTNVPGDIPQLWNPPGVPNGGTSFSYDGSLVDPDSHWEVTWNIIVDADPFTDAGFAIKNTTANTITFNLVTVLPIFPTLAAPTLMGGSTGGSVTDANFDGVGTAATTNGIPFYAGTIDGVSELPIYPDPNSWSVTAAGGTASIPATNVGLPGPTIVGPDVSTNIGIHHVFTLTPGDRVSLTSFFVVVPEPGAAALLAIGSVAALRKRRR